jgi:hypothetical protein
MPLEVGSLAEWEATCVPDMLSVLIPAHNEEKHIAETIDLFGAALREPRNRYSSKPDREQGRLNRATSCRNSERHHPGITGRHRRNHHADEATDRPKE